MKRAISILAGGLLAAAVAVFAMAHVAAADDKHEHGGKGGKAVTVVGELIDTACFISSGGDAKGSGHASCGRECLASGVPAGILPEGSTDAGAVMILLTNPAPFAAHVSKTIKVDGTAFEALHAIDVKKAFVKEGDGWKPIELKDAHHKS
jgi:hypothetical protein